MLPCPPDPDPEPGTEGMEKGELVSEEVARVTRMTERMSWVVCSALLRLGNRE